MTTEPNTGLRGALRACRDLAGWTVLFSAAVNLLYLAPSLFMMQVYDRVLNTGGGITLLFLGLVLLFALSVLALLDMMRQRLAARVSLRLDKLLAPAIIGLAIAPGNGADGAKRVQAARDFDTLRQAVMSPAAIAALDIPWLVVFVAACFLIHPWIGVLTLAGGGVLVLMAWCQEKAVRPELQNTAEAAPRYYAVQEAARVAAEAVRAMGMRDTLITRQLARRREFLTTQMRAFWIQTSYSSASRFWRLGLQSAVLALGALLAIQHQITPGALIGASILAARALAPLDQVVGGWRQIEQGRLAYRTLTQLLDDAPAEAPRTALPAPRGQLRTERVSVRVPGASRLALSNVSVTVEPGEIVGVVGPSGAGKSTFARVICGAIAPDAGVVRIDGANIADWPSDGLGKYVGYMPQDVLLLEGTVAENIRRFALPSAEADALTIAAAQAAGAHEMILRLHKAYDTPLDARGRGLSLGQAQRVALARALYGDPVLLVLDEPNAHLDADGELALVKAITEARARGAAVIVVAHRVGVTAAVDRLMVLRDGAVETIGPRDEVSKALARAAGAAANLTPLRRESQS